MKTLSEAKSALREAESALEEAITREARMKKQHYLSISEIAHDIKNPLTAMIGYIAIMQSETLGPIGQEKYKPCINTLHVSANRLLGICESLLGDNLDSVNDDSFKQVVNVGQLIDEIEDLFQAQAKDRGINLKSSVNDNFPDLRTDPNALYRALMNLVSNAIKFTPRGGKVEIVAEVDKKDGAVIMVVRDSGVGMTLGQIENVIRSHESTVSPHGDVGTGHGLAIVNRIVRDLGGSVDIVSTENLGTKVKLRIPKEIAAHASLSLVG